MKILLFFSLFISLEMFGQAVELKPGSNGFVMIPNVSSLGGCGVADKGKIVYYGTDNSLRMCNGSSWVNISAGVGPTLPYSQSMSINNTLFSITNTEQPNNSYDTEAISATITGNAGTAIWAEASNYSPTYHTYGIRVFNRATNGYGMGISAQHAGSGTGVFGYAETGYGVRANAGTGTGGHFSSNNGYALTTGTGNVGIGTTTPAAKMDIKGTNYSSHFYYDTVEDTYIRGGKAGSKVLINDIAGMGSVGIGLSTPNEILDVNGRMRIRHTIISNIPYTSGLWMSNSTNSLNAADGAFYGMKLNTEAGIFIGGDWRFWVNNLGQVSTSALAGLGNRPLYANIDGTITAAASAQILRLQPTDFQPLLNSSTLIRNELDISFTGVGKLVAAVNLPVGAKINSILMRVKDSNSSGRILYSLEKLSTTSNIAIQLSSDGTTIGSTNASPLNWLSTNLFPVTIESSNIYYINITAYDNSANLITWSSGSTFDLRWIEINYTY